MKAKPNKPKSGRIGLDNEAIILAAAEHEFAESGYGGAPDLTAYLSPRRAGRTMLLRQYQHLVQEFPRRWKPGAASTGNS